MPDPEKLTEQDPGLMEREHKAKPPRSPTPKERAAQEHADPATKSETPRPGGTATGSAVDQGMGPAPR